MFLFDCGVTHEKCFKIASFLEKLKLVNHSRGGLDLAIFRVLGVRQNSHINKYNWALWSTLE